MANQKITIHFSEEDLQDLLSGEEFNWTFPTENGEDIDVRLFQGEEEEDICPEYNEPVLPDENGDCSLCGKHKAK